MTITGRMTFTSEKSMEIKVVADVENLLEGKMYILDDNILNNPGQNVYCFFLIL